MTREQQETEDLYRDTPDQYDHDWQYWNNK